jgi:hypothetical protein
MSAAIAQELKNCLDIAKTQENELTLEVASLEGRLAACKDALYEHRKVRDWIEDFYGH